MRAMLISLVGATVLLALAVPADAAAPVVEHRVPFAESTPFFYVSCGAIDVVATAYGVVTTKDFYDASGTLVAHTETYRFTGTLSNADDPSRSLPYWGHGVKQWNYSRSTFLWTNMYQTVVDDQHRVLESGTYRVDASGDSFLHGISADADVVCPVLT